MVATSYSGPDFISAIKDYLYLKNRNYPDKFVLKAVGDRYKLNGTARTLLYRGVFSKSENILHENKQSLNFVKKELFIDTYNFLFTLLNYKLGKLVFIGTDNYCRDTGLLFGKIKKAEYFNETAIQVIRYIQSIQPIYVVFFIDSPVSFSKDHCSYLNSQIEKFKLPGESRLVKSADHELKKIERGVICTTDSAIIKASKCFVADLSFQVINYYYKPDLLNLKGLLENI
jgi:hypothetical protein